MKLKTDKLEGEALAEVLGDKRLREFALSNLLTKLGDKVREPRRENYVLGHPAAKMLRVICDFLPAMVRRLETIEERLGIEEEPLIGNVEIEVSRLQVAKGPGGGVAYFVEGLEPTLKD